MVFLFGLFSRRIEGALLTAPMIFVAASAILGPAALSPVRFDLENEPVLLVLLRAGKREKAGALRPRLQHTSWSSVRGCDPTAAELRREPQISCGGTHQQVQQVVGQVHVE
jgi:hypothetical protein